MDAESGNILFEKNGYSKIYPASTTKVLTCVLALENLDLNEFCKTIKIGAKNTTEASDRTIKNAALTLFSFSISAQPPCFL